MDIQSIASGEKVYITLKCDGCKTNNQIKDINTDCPHCGVPYKFANIREIIVQGPGGIGPCLVRKGEIGTFIFASNIDVKLIKER